MEYSEFYNIIKAMNNKQKIKQIVAECEKIMYTCRTYCPSLENYIDYQYLKVSKNDFFVYSCGVCGKGKPVVDQHFARAFKSLT